MRRCAVSLSDVATLFFFRVVYQVVEVEHGVLEMCVCLMHITSQTKVC